MAQGYPKEGNACANVLRQEMLECCRNSEEASEQGAEGGSRRVTELKRDGCRPGRGHSVCENILKALVVAKRLEIELTY